MKGLFKFGLSKLPKHKGFDYQPRYYDERKERLQKREQEIRERAENGAYSSKDIKFNFRRNSSASNRSKQLMKSNIRLMMIIFLLTIATYYLFVKTDIFSMFFGK
jgi:uncharacterized membrane protein (DUF106 family)